MSLRFFPFLIPALASSDTLEVAGEIIAVRDASAGFALSIDGEAPVIGLTRGDKIRRGAGYRSVRLQNLTNAPLSVTLALGGLGDDVEDYRTNVRPQIASRSTLLWYAGIPVGARSLINAPDPERVEVFFRSPSSNTDQILIYSADDGGALFVTLAPGDRFRVNYTGAIYGASLNSQQFLEAIVTRY
jgi:hypothetical protein